MNTVVYAHRNPFEDCNVYHKYVHIRNWLSFKRPGKTASGEKRKYLCLRGRLYTSTHVHVVLFREDARFYVRGMYTSLAVSFALSNI